MRADYGSVEFLVAGLSSIVGFKRLADRTRDRNDLIDRSAKRPKARKLRRRRAPR